MSTFAKLDGSYVGNQPHTNIVYHDPNRPGAPGAWEEITITKRGQWYDVDFTGDGRKDALCLNQSTRKLEVRASRGDWGDQWNVDPDKKTLWIGDEKGTVTLTLEGYAVVKPLHLEVRGNDFVDANGNRIVYPGIDGFDDVWFRASGRESELDALLRESNQVKAIVRRIWCMGDAGENQVFSLYPQNIPDYFDMVRSLVAYENSFGCIPLFTACVDAQRVMPDPAQALRFWVELNDALIGSGAYMMSVVNQFSKNLKNLKPADFANPGRGVIWSRGSDIEDTKTSPDGNGGKATASELHATRTSYDRALMDSTASPPNMRANGSGMVWMTEGMPFGDANGYTEEQAEALGRAYSIRGLWALAVHHNRQSQRGQLMTDAVARTAVAFAKGMVVCG